LIRLVRMLRDWLLLAAGAVAFAARGRTPAAAYQAFVRLFCASEGRSNDALTRLVTRLAPPYRFPAAHGVLGELSPAALASVTAALDRDGYYVFPARLSEARCESLMAYALSQPSVVREEDGATARAAVRVAYAADRAAPRGTRYDLPMADVVASPDVQSLLCDLSILSVAQAYLRARPVADVLGLWWNTAHGAAPSSAAAQFFHFDLDRVKWLKFFIYLTDVGPESGPHTFVAGSHRSGAIPARLLGQGYARLSDEEVRACYGAERFVEFAAPRGTIIAEDTRGLHKGKVVSRGDRLMLQLQFSNSLFGATYPPARLAGRPRPELSAAIHRFPDIYAAFAP
jgi:hypothetical protein